MSTTSESPLPKSSAVTGVRKSDIWLWLAMVDSVACSSGTGSGTPIDGGATASAMLTCGAVGSLIEGGTPRSVSLTIVTPAGTSSTCLACDQTYQLAKIAMPTAQANTFAEVSQRVASRRSGWRSTRERKVPAPAARTLSKASLPRCIFLSVVRHGDDAEALHLRLVQRVHHVDHGLVARRAVDLDQDDQVGVVVRSPDSGLGEARPRSGS